MLGDDILLFCLEVTKSMVGLLVLSTLHLVSSDDGWPVLNCWWSTISVEKVINLDWFDDRHDKALTQTALFQRFEALRVFSTLIALAPARLQKLCNTTVPSSCHSTSHQFLPLVPIFVPFGPVLSLLFPSK